MWMENTVRITVIGKSLEVKHATSTSFLTAAVLSLFRHSPGCCFFLIRTEFTLELRLRALVFEASSACLIPELDKTSNDIDFTQLLRL